MGNDYPRMLYRAGKGKGPIVYASYRGGPVRDYRVDNKTVDSAADEEIAKDAGWGELDDAVKWAVWFLRLGVVIDFYLRNWKWVWGTLIALVAIVVSLIHRR